MRTLILVLFAIACMLPRQAAAEEPETSPVIIESWNDFGGTIPIAHDFGLRLQGRMVLSTGEKRDAYEASAGLSREIWPRGAIDLTAGYAYAGSAHGLILTIFHEATFGRGVRSYGYAMEQRLRHDGDWHHEGFYRVDAVIAGLHLMHGAFDDIAAGFQIGTGPGYHLARVEARFTFGLKGEAPERVTACVLTFNVP